MATMRRAETEGVSTNPDVDEEAILLPRQSKFSWGIVVVLMLHTAIVNGTSELIWPFINQLILNVGIAPDQESVGFYTGLIETVAAFFSFASVIPGGLAADRWGRKIVLCSTLLGTAIGLAFFGISESLFALVAFRCIGYALGPQLAWSVTLTILGDVSDSSNTSIAFSAVNASYRIGQLFGPLFATFLAHPKTRYLWFQSEFWAHYPYALPCWAGAMTCMVALYATICFIPETSPNLTCKSSTNYLGEGCNPTNSYSNDLPKLQPVTTPIEDETSLTSEATTHRTPHHSGAELFTSHVVQLLISSWVMYFLAIAFFTLFPLWAFTSISSGGLGASEVTIGSYISARAIVQFVGLIPFAYFETRLGVYRLYAYTTTIFTVTGSLCLPCLNLLAKWDGLQSFRFNLAMFFFFFLGGFGNYCTICMAIMINQATPSPQALAQLVGISQSVLMLGQCMAPIIALSLFEFSIKSGLLGGNVIWAFLTGVSLLASLHSFTLEAPVYNK